MPNCNSCNKGCISEDLTTIGNQSVCCLSCVGLLKANEKDACSYCGRPVWKDNYYEIDNLYICSERCKDFIQKKILKNKKVKYVKFQHYKEEKYYNKSPDNNNNLIKNEIIEKKEIEEKNEKNEKMFAEEKKGINLKEKNLYEVYKINYNENNEDDWNRNSFIQKESDLNENENENNNKEELKIVFKIEKSLHNKKTNEIQKSNSLRNKKENNIIKSIINYFNEDDINNYRKYQKTKKKIKTKKNVVRNLLKDNENYIYSQRNVSSLPNLNKKSTSSIKGFYKVEKNPFNQKNDNLIQEPLLYSDSKNNTLKYENSSKYNLNTFCVFNPIRKTENIKIIKHSSYPIDSLNFPFDSLPPKNDITRDSSVNCCFYCKRPIIIRNSIIQKDFCSLSCKKKYYKKS